MYNIFRFACIKNICRNFGFEASFHLKVLAKRRDNYIVLIESFYIYNRYFTYDRTSLVIVP